MTLTFGEDDSKDPFFDRAAIHDPNRFIGRDQPLRFIYEQLQCKQCVSIVGSPLIGKSSLLQLLGNPEIQQRVGYNLNNFQFILLNFADYPQKTQEGFFQDVYNQIMLHCRTMLEDFDSSSEDGFLRLRDLLQHINKKGGHPVLLFDSFDKVTRNKVFNQHFFSFLRNLAIRNLVYYVTASIKQLAEVCHLEAKTSPFFNIFRICHLGPLFPEEMEQLITSFTKDSANHFTPNEISWILEQAGRHPYLVQVTCSTLFQGKFGRDSGSYNLEHIQARIEAELAPTFQNIWEHMEEIQPDSPDEEKFSLEQHDMLEEARRISSPTRLRKIPELSESHLFRNYLCKRFEIENPNIIILHDIKDVLGHWNSISYLTNSRLAETRYVTLHYERELTSSNSANSSYIRKGKFVRELIKAAHTLMRPAGNRSDSDVEWRLYNILHYHYINGHLTCDQIYPRLGIGNRRDFFRKQNDAFEVLLEKVRELEIVALQEE